MLSSKISSKISNRPKSLSGGAYKKFVPAIIIALAMFFASNISSKAQCNPCASGFTPKSFQYTLEGTSCTITVNYCTDCAPIGHTSVRLCDIIIPYGSCNGIQINSDFWEEIRRATLIHNVENCDLGIPPCPHNRRQMDLFQGDCKKLVYDDYYETVTIEECNQSAGTCVNYYSICWNPITQQYEIDFNDFDVVDPGQCGPAFPYIDPLNKFLQCFTTCN